MPGHGDAVERDSQRGLSGDGREAWGNPGAGVEDAGLAPPTEGETELPTLSYSGSCEDPARSQHSICFPLWKDAGRKGAVTTWAAGMSGTKNCMSLWPTHHLSAPVMGDMAGDFLWYCGNRTGRLHCYYLEMAYVFLDVSPSPLPSFSHFWTSSHEQRVREAWFSGSFHSVPGGSSERPQGLQGEVTGRVSG